MKLKNKLAFNFVFAVLFSFITFIFIISIFLSRIVEEYEIIKPEEILFLESKIEKYFISNNAFDFYEFEKYFRIYSINYDFLETVIFENDNLIFENFKEKKLKIDIEKLLLIEKIILTENKYIPEHYYFHKFDIRNNTYKIINIIPFEKTSEYKIMFEMRNELVTNFLKHIFIAIFLIFGILVIFPYAFSYKLNKRIINIVKIIKNTELKNLNIKIKDYGNDELNELVNIHNKMLEKLHFQYQKIREYENNRKKLISNLSHDLRTPLTSIKGYTESLIDNIYINENDKKEILHLIKTKSEYLNYLLEELFVESQIETKKMILNLKKINVFELLKKTLFEYIKKFEEEDIFVEIIIPDKNIFLSLDENKIQRAFKNIIENFFKYGTNGKYFKIEAFQNEEYLFINFEDKGKGIKNTEKIFERFYVEDTSRKDSLGLGLAISKEIIEKHNGFLKVFSELNKFTIFQITLKIESEF